MATPAGAAEERLKYWAIVTLPILTLYVLQTCTPVCPPERGHPPCRRCCNAWTDEGSLVLECGHEAPQRASST